MPFPTGGAVITGTGQIADGVIVNADINASAAIAYSKLNLAAAIAISDLASGTDGEIPTWDANGDADTIGAGNAGEVLTSNGAGNKPAFAASPTDVVFGSTTRAGDAASGNQTIAHGLGRTPKIVRIRAMKREGSGATSVLIISEGQSDGTNHQMTGYINDLNAPKINGHTSSSLVLFIRDGASNDQSATLTVDGTNITLAWTKTGTPSSDTITIAWEAS